MKLHFVSCCFYALKGTLSSESPRWPLVKGPFQASSCSPLQPDDFPEMETLWLLTQAWNTGILLYSLAQYHQAEKWCSLAMRFVRHLGSLRESYEVQVEQLIDTSRSVSFKVEPEDLFFAGKLQNARVSH